MQKIIDQQGRVRVKIVQAAGTEIAPGVIAADPPEAQAQKDQLGWMTEEPCEALGGHLNPRIVLDNGTILWGHSCWWDYVREDQACPADTCVAPPSEPVQSYTFDGETWS